MGVLSNLAPQKVFQYFEEICAIPHGSGNVDQISDYLVAFAKERGLFCIQDAVKNVIIVKEATEGYEDQPPVILQGHMDMVAVKKPDCEIDMKTQGLCLGVEGDLIYAEGTSLGGDDGIAVAYALALLDDETLSHPRLEIVITVDEEVGLDGARAIDLSMLKGHRMINLDSEEEGIFLTSCAGGARVNCHVPVQKKPVKGTAYEIKVCGLAGGHSGAEIHKERGNSNHLMGRVLYRIAKELPLCIHAMAGGLADNAIPRETVSVLVVPENGFDKKADERLLALIKEQEAAIASELGSKDPDMKITVTQAGHGEYCCITGEDAVKCAAVLTVLPNGVQAMCADIPGMVETSLNMGLMELRDEELYAGFSVRSSVESAKHSLIDRIEGVIAMAGGTIGVTGDYPGWKYRVDSPLRDKMIAVYRKMYGVDPKVEGIHAGLECGILGSKIDDLDCVSMGPDMKDIHTTEETLSISSVSRVWEYLVELLKTKEQM